MAFHTPSLTALHAVWNAALAWHISCSIISRLTAGTISVTIEFTPTDLANAVVICTSRNWCENVLAVVLMMGTD